MIDVDVVVVGGGVMGASTAWWLARRGRSVVVLERFAAGHRNGSSHGTERIFRLTHSDPFWVDLCVQSLPLWRELEQDTGEDLLETLGHVDLGTPDELEPKAASARLCGVATSWLEPGEIAERWPGIRAAHRSLIHEEGGRTNAEATVAAMLHRVEALGGSVLFEQPALAILERGDGVEVVTAADTFRADVVVVAAAGWTPDLLPMVAALPTITSSTGQVAFFAPLDAAIRWPTFLDREVYGMPTPDGRVRIGHFEHAVPTHPDRRSFATDPTVAAQIESWAGRHAPGLLPGRVAELSCLFGETADDDYVIDRHGPIVVGCGFGGHGFKLAPLVGRMLADIADGSDERIPRFALSAAR